jgi:two-component system NarL family sensor kinase
MRSVAPFRTPRIASLAGAGLRTRVTIAIAAAIIAALGVATPILLLQAAAERRAIEERAGLATATIAHIVEREAAASLALLDGLASAPSLHAGDYKGLYEQFMATRIPEGVFLSAYDDERQIINTLRPFGAPLPYIRDFGREGQEAVERIHRNGWSISGRTWSFLAKAYFVVISRSVPSNGRRFFLTTVIPETRLQALVSAPEVPANWGKIVIDRYGRTLIGERVEVNPQVPPQVHWLSPHIPPNDQRGSLTVTDGMDAKHFVAFERASNSGWTAAVTVPWSVVSAPQRKALEKLAFGGVALLVVGVVVGLVLASLWERPIVKLTEAAALTAARLQQAEKQYDATRKEVDSLTDRLMSLQEDERRRIAAELHDSTSQHLAAASINLMRLKGGSNSKGTSEAYEEIKASLREAQTEIRIFTYLLHPPNLDSLGLKKTMETFSEGFSLRTGIKVRVRIGAAVDSLPYEVQRSVFRILQEALANVHRHSSATKVAVIAVFRRGVLSISVTDNGRGFQPAPNADSELGVSLGVGIPGMRARLRQFGGNLEIESDARGTSLRAFIPADVFGIAVSNFGTRAAE